MIDGTVRREWIAREARDPATAVLLLDVVLGYGAHPDPAGELVPALQSARRDAAAARRGLVVVTSVIGTERDPQVRSSQVAALRAAGVLVMDSNAQAARLAALIAAHVGARSPMTSPESTEAPAEPRGLIRGRSSSRSSPRSSCCRPSDSGSSSRVTKRASPCSRRT